MEAFIFPDNRGLWAWEVTDRNEMYLRSDRKFESRSDALSNLREETHLIKPPVRLN